MRSNAGFTLIELLIVVAIIGILAAIAVPNFMNAQIRAQIARCVSDMNTLSKALEMYKMDENAYPTCSKARVAGSGDYFHPNKIRFYRMTTPIAYISAIPQDPFATWANQSDYAQWGSAYDYVNGWMNGSTWNVSGAWGYIWRLNSWGPDNINSWGGQRDGQCVKGKPNFIYQSSNGLRSYGDIIWVGAKDDKAPASSYCEINNSV